MPGFARKRSTKLGLGPGALVFIGEQQAETAHIHMMDYTEDAVTEKEPDSIQEAAQYKDRPSVTWVNVDGLRPEVVAAAGDLFQLHPLIQEDILNTEQRPKIDDYEQYYYIVLKMLRYDEPRKEVRFEQVSLVLGPTCVLSFQEQAGDVFDGVRDRIRSAKGRIRKQGPDWLVYALMDAVVDHYFLVLEKIGEDIEELEDLLLDTPDETAGRDVHALRRELSFLRKTVWPLREVLNLMQRGDSRLIQRTTEVFLRDVYDHTIQVMDTIETYREMVSGLLDLYLASVSNRTNAVMKVLTMIATIFIPLSFIAGVYGMNFDRMPELHWEWAYPLGFWTLILIVVSFMLYYFKRKDWL